MSTTNGSFSGVLTTILPHLVQSAKTLTFSWYDYILFTVMLSLSALIGIYFGCFGSKQSTANEYLMGEKSMKVIPISVSLVASHISGITLLAVPADVYKFGATYWLIIMGVIVSGVSTIFVFLPVFYKLQITSTYEYLERRFDSRTRSFASFLFVLSIILYLPIVIYIPALAFSAATGVNVHYITPIVCGVCIFYTTLGGLKAVVWTDTLQFTVTVGAVVTVFILGLNSAGGFSAVWKIASEGERLDLLDFDWDPTKRDSFWIMAIGVSMTMTAMTGIHQSCVQKYLSVGTFAQARRCVIYFSIGMSVIIFFSVFTGLIMYAKYAKCDPFTLGVVKKSDQLLPYYIMDVASEIPGLSGLFIAGIFCAALSTLSASLNCVAGTMYEDFIVKLTGPLNDRKTTHTLKLLVITSGVICTALVFVIEHLGGILPLAIKIGGLTAGPLLGMFTLGVLFPKASCKGTFFGSIIGLLCACWVMIMAQYYTTQGIIKYEPKPISIEGCFNNNFTTTLAPLLNNAFNNTSPSIGNFSDAISSRLSTCEELGTCEKKFVPFILYRISFYYYAPFGTVVTLISALLISYLCTNDDPPVHRDLLSPVIYFALPKEKKDKNGDYYSVNTALHIVTTNSHKDKEAVY